MFSEREEMIIKVIGKKKMTLQEVADEVFQHECIKPFDAAISVGNTIRRIIKKCEYHNLDWTLMKIKRNGKLLINKEKMSC